MVAPFRHVAQGCLLLLFIASSCNKGRSVTGHGSDAEGTHPPPVAGANQPVRSPAEIAALLNQYHRERDYERMEPLIVENQREWTIGFIRRMDKVLENQARVREAATRRFGAILAGAWDLSAIENNLGVFSSRCRIINQSFKGNEAIVTLQEGDHVPLVHARFERTAKGWRYRPKETPRTILAELDALAGLLGDIVESIKSGAGFDAYVNTFGADILPQMGRVVAVGSERRANGE
ncbi:MAG: hypothetical protein ACE5EC_00190 [Phycisphaerae bacterium]